MFRHPEVVLRAAVHDPAVTRHTPMWLWLSTGIRALGHCVEGICSSESSPYGDAQALPGLSLLARRLPKVKGDPDDIAARLACQLGSWLSIAPLVAAVPIGTSHVGREQFDRIARQAMGTPWVPRNPRPIAGPDQVKEILELAA